MREQPFSQARNRYHRFDILSLSDENSDSFGESTQDVSVAGRIWASLEPIAGREYWQGQQIRAETTHGMTCLYIPSLIGILTSKSRLRMASGGKNYPSGARIFEVSTPPQNVQERNREWAFQVKETEPA